MPGAATKLTVEDPEPEETPKAFQLDAIYQDEHRALTRYFRRNRASPDDAGDLVQEAFLRLARLKPGDASIARPAAYLRQIARNLLKDRAKSAARRFEQLLEPVDIAAMADADEVRRLEARDSLARIEAVLARMKPRTREIFLAHRVHGLSYAEIAAETGLSIKGVEKQMSKAIAQLERFAGPR